MLDLKNLGLSTTYLPGFPLAPEPKTPSLRKNPPASFVRPGRRVGDPITAPEGAVISGVIASLGQLDHFFRRALDMGFFKSKDKFEKNGIQYKLKNLVLDSDRMLVQYASQYDSAVADSVNRVGGVLGQAAELLSHLSPRQKQSALTHMHNMAEQNIDYVPLPVAIQGPLPTSNGWRLVAVESPYAGDVEANLRYLRACLRDCLSRRETPLAAHGLLTQPGVVNQEDEVERELAAEAGVAWTQHAQLTVVYTDLGMSPGMKEAVARANHEGRPVEYRTLPDWAPQAAEGEAVEVSETAIGPETAV